MPQTRDVFSAVSRIGEVMSWTGTGSIPTQFLLCDGSAVSRTTYSDLFSAIGTTYGAGDGSTTFNLPNSPSSAVGKPTLYGGIIWQPAAGGDWTTSSSSYASFAAQAAFTLPSGANLIGNASAPATKIPAITFASLPPGDYLIQGIGNYQAELTGGSQSCYYRFHDGTNPATGENCVATEAASGHGPITEGRFSYTTAQTNITFQVQAKLTNGGTSCDIRANSSGSNNNGTFTILVYRYPNQAAKEVIRALF